MGQINEKTQVPLGWVLAITASLMSLACLGAFWVSTVNERLSRIEQRLGIVPYSGLGLIPEAQARGKK